MDLVVTLRSAREAPSRLSPVHRTCDSGTRGRGDQQTLKRYFTPLPLGLFLVLDLLGRVEAKVILHWRALTDNPTGPVRSRC
jgi:hypothetical protein